MRIWDLHIHPEGARIPGKTLTEKVETILEVGARVGIERIGVFFMLGKDEPEILRIMERFRDRVFGFVWLHLWKDPVEATIAKLNRWVADGPMIGMKLGGDSGHYSVPAYDPVFRRAVELKAVMYLHTWLKIGGDPPWPGGGNLPQESRPQDVVAVASRYPEAPFICGHTGGDWELGVRAVRSARNVLVEIGGGYPAQGQVEMAIRELGAERVIFGSDVSGRGFASQLAKVHGAAISDREKELIFSGNLHRIMRPILEAKGMVVR